MSGVLEKLDSFREDYLGTYYYDDDTNEVTMLFKTQNSRLEASVLIECLAGLIIDISQVQSTGKTGDEG